MDVVQHWASDWSFWCAAEKLIDVDEFGVTFERCNRKYGWAPKFSRVRKDGHYGHGTKITVLFAIEPGDPTLPENARGSLQNPRQWIRCLRRAGTTAVIFGDFINSICNDIEQFGHDGTDDHRIFMWDNLAAHHAGYVHQMVNERAGSRQFSILARPPYHPKYGPIEYKICDVISRTMVLKQKHWTMEDLEHEICRIGHTLGQFDSTFAHCGYSE